MEDWQQKIFDELDFLGEKKKTLKKEEKEEIEKIREYILQLAPEQQKPLWELIEKVLLVPNKSPQLLTKIVVAFMQR